MVRFLVVSSILVGCSEYGFRSPAKEDGGDTADGAGDESGTWPPPGSDTDPGDDTGGGSGDDTAPGGDTSPGSETGTTADGCYEPEDGYASNPEARIVVTDSGSQVVVSLVLSDTAYSDDLVLDSPEAVFLVHGRTDAPGTAVSLGPYGPESELIFGLNVLDTGDHWQSGPASRNADGVAHVAVTYEGGCSWLIGFEDLYGGGDLDFNDVVLRVSGPLRQDG